MSSEVPLCMNVYTEMIDLKLLNLLVHLTLNVVLVMIKFVAYNLDCLPKHLSTGKNRTLFLLVLTVYRGTAWMVFLVTVVVRSLLLATKFLCPVFGTLLDGLVHRIQLPLA